jgi:uncharacterized integral membrane protein (TIGR00698 family)
MRSPGTALVSTFGAPASALGVLICLVVAAALVSLEEVSAALPGPMIAIVIGIALGRVWGRPLAAGAELASSVLLRAGIVLLGARLSMSQLRAVGPDAALVIVPCVVVGGVAAWLIARRLGLSPSLSALLAVGTAVCGNSAIAACAPLIRTTEDEVATAVATVTVYGSFALVALPLIGATLGLSSHEFGLWAGAVINDTSQVVASAFSFSSSAGATATIVKLTRNLFILVAVVAVPALPALRATKRSGSILSTVPWFILGFVALAAFVSFVEMPPGLLDIAGTLSKVLIMAALVGIGVGATSLRLNRSMFNPLLAGVGAGAIVAAVGLGVVTLAT